MLEPIIWSIIVLGGLGAVFGIMLGVASKKFAVKKDERVVAVRENLPGANCGGCGYAGCDALADALVAGKAEVTDCAVLSQDGAQKIAEVLGVCVGDIKPKVARIMCLGSEGHCKNKFEYDGARDCRAAYGIAGGFKACAFACLGLGTCAKVCKFDAITMGPDGIAFIDEDKCTGCGRCVEQCPQSSIAIIERDVPVYTACTNTGRGREVMENCSAGCIGCGKCASLCPFGAIKMIDNLPVVNEELCRNCGLCVEQCPRKCILETASLLRAKINPQKCVGCTLCSKACPFDAIDGTLKMTHKITDKCRGCGLCVEACKLGAITMVNK
ncbi:MAG: 4Fe-4S binding protein [Christensenella sp.]